MNAAMDYDQINWAIVPKWSPPVADEIAVELHDPVSYGNIVYAAAHQALNNDGTATVNVPAGLTGSYFITIRHRHHVETTSAAPVSFAGGGAVVYDFTAGAGQAYGGNEKDVGGTAVIWSGDLCSATDQYPGPAVPDGVVDLADVYYVYGAYQDGIFGYALGDVNGDGAVDLADVYVVFDNYLAGVYACLP